MAGSKYAQAMRAVGRLLGHRLVLEPRRLRDKRGWKTQYRAKCACGQLVDGAWVDSSWAAFAAGVAHLEAVAEKLSPEDEARVGVSLQWARGLKAS